MTNTVRFPLSGAAAGAFSAVVFMVVHDLLISDIWFSLIPMLLSGALCGAAVSWTYAMLFPRPALVGWLSYNVVYVAVLVAMGLVSLLIYEPVATAAALIAAGGAPTELIRRATPLSAISILFAAALLHWLWGRGPGQFLALLLSSTLVVVLLGLNVSVLGLVEFDTQGWVLVLYTYALTLLLNLVYLGTFAGIERRAFREGGGALALNPAAEKNPVSITGSTNAPTFEHSCIRRGRRRSSL
jgi:hypothetical protein